jgi:hypothetical protein
MCNRDDIRAENRPTVVMFTPASAVASLDSELKIAAPSRRPGQLVAVFVIAAFHVCSSLNECCKNQTNATFFLFFNNLQGTARVTRTSDVNLVDNQTAWAGDLLPLPDPAFSGTGTGSPLNLETP